MRDLTDFNLIKIGDTVEAIFWEDGIIVHRLIKIGVLIDGVFYGEDIDDILTQGEEYPYEIAEDNFIKIIEGE